MMLTIVREKQGSMARKVGEVSIEGRAIRVRASHQLLSILVANILDIPTKIKIRKGNKVFKRSPSSPSENLRATLKQNLHDPYRLQRDVEELEGKFVAKYEDLHPLSMLSGEERHDIKRAS
jgi:hypothetical protein